MTGARALAHAVTVAVAVVLAGGCFATPTGVFRSQPELLNAVPLDGTLHRVPPATVSKPIVVKRFESNYRSPVGGHYEAPVASPRTLSQTYAPTSDLGWPVFDNVVVDLQGAGFVVWKDYDPNPQRQARAPEAAPALVVSGSLDVLEIYTFRTEAGVDEAARAVLTLTLADATGHSEKVVLEATARITRGSGPGDVLRVVSNRLATAVGQTLNRKGASFAQR